VQQWGGLEPNKSLISITAAWVNWNGSRMPTAMSSPQLTMISAVRTIDRRLAFRLTKEAKIPSHFCPINVMRMLTVL